MRQAINNLQATHSGFKFVNDQNVFKVADQPSPVVVQEIIKSALAAKIDPAMENLLMLWKQGYAALDIISTLQKVARNMEMAEYMKLEYLKVCFVVLLLAEVGCAQWSSPATSRKLDSAT